ncbi:hypothetical protein F5884DRAFT_853083 [Xylogone sp. PMI_703]|nr:hypothetical protein F5884DRAFT_853083 [Xylogone sp. PMI_703]
MATETPPCSPGGQSSKRKRDQQDLLPSTPLKQQKLTPTKLSTSDGSVSPENLSARGSPRTKVARQFQGLHLEEQSGDSDGQQPRHNPTDGHSSVNEVQSTTIPPSEGKGEDVIQKDSDALPIRDQSSLYEQGMSQSSLEIPETPPMFRFGDTQGNTHFVISSSETNEVVISKKSKEKKYPKSDSKGFLILPCRTKNEPSSSLSTSNSTSQSDSSSNNKSSFKSAPKSRPKKRSGTPPPSERPIIDPERASQTWQEEEITGFTISDPDDDGEGINGIGFRPTAAMAYARAEKRRAQVLEYRNREAREARARRSERRRGDGVVKRTTVNGSRNGDVEVGEGGRRKVRFQDAEVKTAETP